MRTSMRRHCLSSRRGGSRSWSSAAAGALHAMLLSALSVSSHSVFGDSVHRMRSVLSGYQGGAAIFRAVSAPRRGWTKFAICAVASYKIRSDGPREAALLSTLRSTLWQATSSLFGITALPPSPLSRPDSGAMGVAQWLVDLSAHPQTV